MNKTKKITYIITGYDDNINNFLKEVEELGNAKGIKIKKFEYAGCNILFSLSANQKKILKSAKEFGYYDYPRKITINELSDKIGLSKDITIESLRKAEKNIISLIFDDDWENI